ncbi:MAG: single-stranded-DNA-specific exonuclease RecJ [Candidatus Buchananbacteria bacterium]|nr:single-stranded-DNA-specific exonuclease RecJ [Candidatus Buchananbacteria bacterium]
MKNWQIRPKISQKDQDKFPEINPLILQLLANRDLKTQAQIDEFLNPDYGTDLHDPFLFVDMEKAVERIMKGIEKKEKMVVYGDYDADGVSSTAILFSALEAFGADVDVYIPFRETEGYGLNMAAVKKLIDQGVKLIVTVDCGTSNAPEVEELVKNNVDIIITDHHQQPLVMPEAYAIINQNTDRDTYPYKNLCGAGVAFKVVQALTLKQANYQVEQLADGWEKWLLDLVAIGTVADMMKLIGENRTLVKYGLVVLNKTKRPGLQNLIKIANGDKLLNIDEKTIGFQIGPRLNAAGRLDHAGVAYRLLVTEDKEEATKLAENINATNKQRQTLTDLIAQEARTILGEPNGRKLLAAVGDGWPMGVVGLIAGRIADQYYTPTLVISKFGGEIIGSGRSIEGFNIVKALQECDQYLSRYGGHAQACGFTLKDEKQVDEFIAKMTEIATREIGDKVLVPNLEIESEVKLSEINWQLFENLEIFKPFGEGNPKPKFVAKSLNITEIAGVGADNKHLRLMVSQNDENSKKLIGFGFGEWLEKLKVGDLIDVVFEVDVNEWNGNRELQLKIIDLKQSN